MNKFLKSHDQPPQSQTTKRRAFSLALIVASAISVLSACQFFGIHRDDDPNPKPAIASMYVSSATGQAFQLKAIEESPSSADDLLRLASALDTAYGLLDFQPPYPAIKVVTRSHPYLESRAMASAAVDVKGREHIVFRRKFIRSNADPLPLAIHELSHLKAWRLYGTDIPLHGRKFRKICRNAASRKACAPQRKSAMP